MKRSKLWILLAVITVGSVSALAQTSQTGLPPFSSRDGGVDLANLNVHLTIPVLHKNGRGLPFTYDLDYDSTFYGLDNGVGETTGKRFFLVNTSPLPFSAPVFGWSGTLWASLFTGGMGSTRITCQSGATGFNNFFFIDIRGAVHPLPASLTVSTDPACGQQQVNAFSTDQAGYEFALKGDGSGVVTDSSGTTGNMQGITDRNGNTISLVTNSDFTKTIVDTLGTTPLSTSSTFDSLGNTLTQTFTYTVSGGRTASVVVNYKVYQGVASAFGCSGTADYFASHSSGLGHFTETSSLPDNIVLPDGSKYSFTYEPTPNAPGVITGRLQSVILPTGATISYGYPGPNGGVSCADGSLLHLTVTTADGTWEYDRSVSSSAASTTIIDPQGNQTVVTFQPIIFPQNSQPPTSNLLNWIETQRQIYQGSSTLLQTVVTCYNGNKANCNITPVTFPITEVSIFSQLPNGKQNEQDTFRDANSGLMTEFDEYDFGTNQPGPLLRKTITTYASLGNNIFGQMKSVTVCSPGGADTACNGAGTRVAQTTFEYDQDSLTTTTGITQHVAVSGSRGNLTTMHRWLNTNNTTLDSTNTYDDTGNVLTATDPGGHTTSLTYGQCNGAFVTQTSMPDTNSPNLAHHTTSATYDCGTALPSTSTDQNGNVTSFFYDNMFRSTEVDFPDGGQTSTSYPDPNHVVVQNKIDSTRSSYSTSLLDGYGRVSRTATKNDESTPYDQQDYCYDSNGRLGFKTYVYQGNGFSTPQVCSGAGDSFTYDALGRPTHITHSDGSATTNTYTGNATQITDEGNGSSSVSRIQQRNGLGRLTAVCEIYGGTALFGNEGTPGNCGMDIAGTGFNTFYAYNTIGDLTNVTQSQFVGVASRSYGYDSLSRMTSETTPEAGTATYTYNADSLLTQRVRPAPNQTSPANTVTTNYQYDSLHRQIGKTYSGIPTSTPSPVFNYDETSVWNTALFNTNGRLSSQKMGVPLSAEQIFSYDAAGRPTLNAQCTPNTCNLTPLVPYTLGYQYDLLGNMISAGNGVGVTFGYSYNLAARLTRITSSLSDGNHPGTLVSNMHYSPASVTDFLGNGVLETASFSPRGLLTSVQAINTAGTKPGAGSVGISGSLQSQTQPGTPGTGWVSVAGSEQTGSSTVSITVAGSGFETPALGSGANAYQYHPTGSNWTFGPNSGFDGNNNIVGGSGITGNNSGFTSSNSAAPEGAQVAFLQGGSANFISQSLSGFQAGVSYTVSFQAAQRGNFNSGGQDFDVYLDSTLLATFRPASTNYALLSTPAFTTTAGTHTLKFVGRDSAGGNGNAAFIDVVRIMGTLQIPDSGTVTVSINGTPYTYSYGASDNAGTIAAGLTSAINSGSLAHATSTANSDVALANSGFEIPALGTGNFQYSPTGGSWTFGGGTGISANGSGFTSGNPGAPEGSQVAFIQMGSDDVFSQSLSGFQTGVSYTVSFSAAQRGNSSNGGQDFDVYLDSSLLGTFRPAGTSYSAMSTAAFTTTAGTHALRFVGRDSAGGNNTAFIDAVRVTAATGNTIVLTSNTSGTAGNYSLSVSYTWNNTQFTNPSFTSAASGSGLTGGQNAVTTYDQGATTITVNNHPDSYSWSGSATTPASIAQGLCTTINSDAAAFVSASCTSGSATVNLVSKVSGASTDYSLSASSNSGQSSFSASCPGFASCSNAFLSGGATVSPYSFTLGRAPDAQITSANDVVNGNWTFTYDQFNRLAGSNKNLGAQTFTYVYDRYGNRWQQNAPQGGPAAQFMFDDHNHFVGSGVIYDPLGNIINDGFHTYNYDAENRLIQVDGGATATYVYDADGRRVHGPNGEYVYDLGGRVITQFTLGGVWSYGEIYAGGHHLATYSNATTNFYHGDWLGTKRVMTGVNGAVSETCTGFHFGDGVNCTGTNWTFNSFTDDIHDPETNLEHTLYRQYSGTQGRWLIPDPAGIGSADPANPQSWNRYTYVKGNVVNAVDPTGLDDWDDGDGGVGLGLNGFGGESLFAGCPFNPLCHFGPDMGMLFHILPGDFQVPRPTLSDSINWLLSGILPDTRCAMSPIPDLCGLTNGFASQGIVPPDFHGPCDTYWGPQQPDCNDNLNYTKMASNGWVPNCRDLDSPGASRGTWVADAACKEGVNTQQCAAEQKALFDQYNGGKINDKQNWVVLVGPKYGNDQHVYTVCKRSIIYVGPTQ